MIYRSLTVALLGTCMLSACIVVERRPAESDVPAWQRPNADASQRTQPRGPMPRADLRLSTYQSASPPPPAVQAPPPADEPWADEPEADSPWAGDAWPPAAGSVDPGIYPDVFPATASRTSRPAQRQPAPAATARAGAPPSASGLGPGDLVRVTVFGQPELETSTVVSDGGSITLPLVGPVNVGGLDSQQAERAIARAYSEGGYLVDPQITLTVQELRSRQVSVLGQVQNPGRFPLASRMTLLDALALAGGVTQLGGSDVFLIRKVAGQARKFEINIDNMLGAPGANTLLELGAGDTVYVPEAPRFYIYGEVRRPDAYALKPGMTVMQAISVGGGLTDRGSDSRIRIRRTTDDGTREFRAALDDEVREGDVVYVKERLF